MASGAGEASSERPPPLPRATDGGNKDWAAPPLSGYSGTVQLALPSDSLLPKFAVFMRRVE